MTTPEFNIPINLKLDKENIGVLRSVLQQVTSNAQNIGTLVDNAAQLPGVSNTFRRNTVQTQKATRAMQRDYQVMRIETARIETPLRQTARAARSVENIAKSTNVAIRTSARLHNDIHGLLQGEQTIQETINKLGKTRVDSEEKLAKSVDRQAIGLEGIQSTIAKITGNITEGTFGAGQNVGYLTSHLSFASGLLLVMGRHWSKIASLILTALGAIQAFNLALKATRRVFSTIQTSAQRAGDIIRQSFTQDINPEIVQRRQIQADVLGVPIDQLNKALVTYSAVSVKAATDTANLVKVFSPTELATLQQFREEYQALTASKRSLSDIISISLLPIVEFLNRAIFPIIRALTNWFSANKTLAQFLVTAGIAALFIVSAGLVLLAAKLLIATGAAAIFTTVIYTALAPLLPFIIAGIALAAVIGLIVVKWQTIVNWFKIGIAIVRDLWDRFGQGAISLLLLIPPIGLVIKAIRFLIDNFGKIKSTGLLVLNVLLTPFRKIINIIREMVGLLSKLGGFFGKILNLGGPDSHLARTLVDQREIRKVEAEELSARAQALANLPGQIIKEDPPNAALTAQRASFLYTSPIKQQIDRSLPTTSTLTPTLTPTLAPTLAPRLSSGLHATARDLAPERQINRPSINRPTRPEHLQGLINSGLHTIIRALTPERSETGALADTPNASRPDTRQEQLQTLIKRQEYVSNVSTTNITNRNSQQTDIKVENKYDIEGVADPEEVANLVTEKQISELAAFAR